VNDAEPLSDGSSPASASRTSASWTPTLARANASAGERAKPIISACESVIVAEMPGAGVPALTPGTGVP